MELVGRIEAVCIADGETFLTRDLDEIELKFGGMEGDRHFGLLAKAGVRQPMYKRGQEIMNRRQLSLVSVEELREIAERIGVPEVKGEWLGANLVVSGIPELTKLPMGLRFMLPSGAGIVLEGENEPCSGPGRIIAEHYGDKLLTKLFIQQAQQKRGLVGYVERPGLIRRGDLFRILR
ncbi:MOSC domain-containing protein [Paenibacillus whitsoniae]|nr:MOSC domain-containing protein [Paenibacillus whitsoniae]